MRRSVAVLVVALLALTLVGCGGGGEEEAAAPPATGGGGAAAPAPAPAPAADPNAQPIVDRSADSSETFLPFASKATSLPPAVQARLDEKQAMLILFYNGAQKQTDDLRREVDAVVADNTGMIDLITYDLGKYTAVDANGVVTIDRAKIGTDPAAQQAVSFARTVGVDQVPYLIIVDDQGYQIYWHRGFIDTQLLERQVQRAAR